MNGKWMGAAAVAGVSACRTDVHPAHHLIGHGHHPTAVTGMECTQAGSLRHRERLQPDLTQRDMWVMHSRWGEEL
ncbi:MAG: hypothetical protein KatS3mg056_0217 [Chloroflexus sp.]|jgi:hypothetical protein|nr:MAG: hypothetical protein D6716_09610 [Chloroflexota bacterium]GIV91508.1 MAG: hypothetical protein KatS3mg056_0217 [Chloroflexus sp.]